jgi:2-polyprenyl-3-methyl-5-hydroxy-6-metoxy-1,4-benzoquinol methylase
VKTRLQEIDESLVREWVRDLPRATTNGMAIPSYYHHQRAFRWLFRRRLEEIIRMVLAGPHDRVMDFGCGIGLLALNLAPYCKDIFVRDLEMHVITQTVEHFHLGNVSLLQGECWHEICGKGSLDVIIAADVLEHISDLSGISTVFERLLGNHGRIILSGPTEHWIYRLGRFAAGFKNEYHHHNIKDIRYFLCGRGYKVIAEKHLPLPWIVDAFHILTLARQ